MDPDKMQEDSVEKTLNILKYGTKRNLDKEDLGLLSTLQHELRNFYANMNYGGDSNSLDETITQTSKSLDFLASWQDKQKTCTDPSVSTDTQQRPMKTQHDPFITCSIQEGRKVFFMDGIPIKFKIPKNKPKNGAFEYQWAANFQALVDFKDLYGHTRVTRTTPGYEELGNWVAEQRRKLKKSKITEKQFEILNSVGFEWDRSHYFFNTYQKKKLKMQSPSLLTKSYSA